MVVAHNRCALFMRGEAIATRKGHPDAVRGPPPRCHGKRRSQERPHRYRHDKRVRSPDQV